MANRYFINGGVNDDWNDTSNWSTTSGGAGGSSIPAGTDDVFFDANSPSCDLNTTTGLGLTFTATGYTGTLTLNTGITISGNVTLGSGMSFGGTGQFRINSAGTITSNGVSLAGHELFLSSGSTTTLADNLTVGDLKLGNGSTGTTTINGNTIYGGGSLTMNLTTGIITGTTNIVLNGTGTIYGATSTGQFQNNLTINTYGTITFDATNFFRFNTGTLTYTAGTVITTGSTLANSGSATNLNTDGIIWYNVIFTGATTNTLSSDLSCNGLLTLGSSTNNTTINGYTMNVIANLTIGVTTGNILGTTKIVMSGTGSIDMTSATAGKNYLEIQINSGNGTTAFNVVSQQATYPIRHISGNIGGFSEKSTYFNGSNQYVTMGDNFEFDIADSFTFAFWFKSSVNGGVIMSKAKSSSPYTGYWIQIATSQLLLEMYNAGGTIIGKRSSTTVTGNKWIHGVVTYSGTGTPAGIKVYVNGVSESGSTSGTTLGGSILTNYPYNLGASNNGFWDYTGSIDEVIILNRALTQAEVTELYNNGVVIDPIRLSFYNDISSYYKLGEGNDNGTTVYDSKGAINGTTGGMTSANIIEDARGKLFGLSKNYTKING